ncbi:uncharacterized protein [Montipora foliosa]|uniref:uncharacterized protein n=1 Tax=Montipora foliosa TaxID=591990 RepID=UPI0035F1DC7D
MAMSELYRKSVRAVAVDEAHVICHWGQSQTQKHAAFRAWFSKLHEFRSLLPACPFIALTATATSDTRDTIFESLLFNNPCTIVESPNKDNISYVVNYMKKNLNLSDYFSWLADEVLEKGILADRTIIYCQTIKKCALVYTTLKILLGGKMYEDLAQQDPKRVLLEMLHSCTPATNKQHILESFQSDTGCIRILVATIAFGMGVDCKQVHRTVHFGPAMLRPICKKVEEQAGMEPLHLCCDNCSLQCKCGLPECTVLSYPISSKTLKPSSSDTQRNRTVSTEQTILLGRELSKFHKSLLIDLLKSDSSGNLKLFNHPTLLLGFSDVQITQVMDHCSELFTLGDICDYVEIWDMLHARKIYSIMQKVFGDMVATNTNESVEEYSPDEEDDLLLPEDWNNLLLDKELVEMAIEEFSQIEMNDSDDTFSDSVLKEVPSTALTALMNLSFDAVL